MAKGNMKLPENTEEALRPFLRQLLKLIRKHGKKSEKVRSCVEKNKSVPGFDNLASLVLQLSD